MSSLLCSFSTTYLQFVVIKTLHDWLCILSNIHQLEICFHEMKRSSRRPKYFFHVRCGLRFSTACVTSQICTIGCIFLRFRQWLGVEVDRNEVPTCDPRQSCDANFSPLVFFNISACRVYTVGEISFQTSSSSCCIDTAIIIRVQYRQH